MFTTATTTSVVMVTFHPGNDPKFQIASADLPGPSPNTSPSVKYTVFWKLAPGSAEGTELVSIQNWTPTQPALPGNFTTLAPPAGALAQGILNSNYGTGNIPFGYQITVRLDDITHSSNDPEVVLEPPGN